MKKIKRHSKGFVAGFLLCAMISATIVWANPGGVMREVFYGVNVVVNGVPQNFPEDMTPFMTGGRTFLPVRAIADIFDVPVDWDGSTTTVFIGEAPEQAPRPLLEATPMSSSFSVVFSPHSMSDIQYDLVLSSQTTVHPHPLGGWARFDLNGEFNTISGILGRINDSSGASTLRFIGDGEELAAFIVDGTTVPGNISVDVSGVLVLQIEIDSRGMNRAQIGLANPVIQ